MKALLHKLAALLLRRAPRPRWTQPEFRFPRPLKQTPAGLRYDDSPFK